VHRPRNNAALVISRGEIRDGKWDILLCPDSIREENPMQDLIQNYVSDLHKLREVFHKERGDRGRAVEGNGPLR
jgi:hypothetical protein